MWAALKVASRADSSAALLADLLVVTSVCWKVAQKASQKVVDLAAVMAAKMDGWKASGLVVSTAEPSAAKKAGGLAGTRAEQLDVDLDVGWVGYWEVGMVEKKAERKVSQMAGGMAVQ